MTTASHGLFATLIHLVLPLCLLCIAVMAAARVLAPAAFSAGLRFIGKPRVAIALSAGILALFGAMLWVRMSFPGFIDPGEPIISAISYFSLHHEQVYQSFDPYGPGCYLPYGLALWMFPPHVALLKVVITATDIALMVLLFLVYRTRIRAVPALLTTSLVVAALLMDQSYLLQIRGDIFIYFGVALALLSALARSRYAWLLFGLALALGVGVKITGILYLLAPCAILLERQGIKRLLGAAGIAAVLNIVPFALPSLSLREYVFWLSHMSHELRSSKEFAGNLFTTLVLLLPCALVYVQMTRTSPGRARQYLRERALMLAAFLGGIGVADVISAKVGAGRHHLAPFFIVAGYIAVDMYAALREFPRDEAGRPSLLLASGWCVLGILLIAAEDQTLNNLRSLVDAEWSQAVALNRDVASIVEEFPGKRVEMGAGAGTEDLNRTYSPEYGAAYLVFRGNPYNFDTSLAADNEMLRLPFPAESMRDIANCEGAVWLIPKGQAPFETESIYSRMYPREYPHHIIFTPQIRQSFIASRMRIGSSRFFDLYGCKTGQGEPEGTGAGR
jgi:hypothetical protein